MKRASIFVLCLLAAACGGGARGKLSSPARTGIGESCRGTSVAEAISPTGSSATIALAKIEGRRIAFVADEDAKAILTVDTDTRAQIAATPLGGTPGQVYVAKDGRVLATVRDRNEIVALAASRADAPLDKLCARPTPAEPIAIAATPDGATLVVSAGWGQKVALLDAATLASKQEVGVPREPRSIVVADDGKTAFVSHSVGSVMSVVSLEQNAPPKTIDLRGADASQIADLARMERTIMKAAPQKDPRAALQVLERLKEIKEERQRLSEARRPTCQGFALAKSSAVPGRVFAPQVFVDPGDLENRTEGYGDVNQDTETPSIAVIDEGALEPIAASMVHSPQFANLSSFRERTARDSRVDCLLPRAAVVDPTTKSLFVTCYGIDAVVAYDARSPNPLFAERRRWTVGAGPSGIAIDGDKRRAVVWSQFDRTISTFPIGGLELVDEKAVTPLVQKSTLAPLAEKVPAEYALGRILFHAAGDTRISSDGRACASCHPDGRDDAITWATPEGPRRSIMLAGRVTRTAPYSWNGNENSIPNHLGNTFDRLSGKGLRSIELDALVAYLSNLPTPPATAVTDKAKIDRGAQIFASKEAGCSGCHAGADFTDGKNHDVGSRHTADREAAFNTPSLHLVGGTGPYFHDGRYKTLSQLLRQSDGKMGNTKHLSGADLDALESYVRTL
jgi:DNA-binding beta-propeller fold protein YncE/mono/diheme cytochrome c family protein